MFVLHLNFYSFRPDLSWSVPKKSVFSIFSKLSNSNILHGKFKTTKILKGYTNL